MSSGTASIAWRPGEPFGSGWFSQNDPGGNVHWVAGEFGDGSGVSGVGHISVLYGDCNFSVYPKPTGRL
jgi:hypothetical protein